MMSKLKLNLKLGQIINVDGFEKQVTGFYKTFCESSTEGYKLIAPCKLKEAEYVKYSIAEFLPIKKVKVVDNPKYTFSCADQVEAFHKEDVKEFEERLKANPEEPPIFMCFKVRI
jgi:hypothetical protein